MLDRGPWIQLYSGTILYILDPRPEDISIVDIAHSLSNICRYAGNSLFFYSVAEHSIYVSEHFKYDKELALAALLHDAAEVVISDIPRMVKKLSPQLTVVENKILRAIYNKFCVEKYLHHEEIKNADNLILRDEMEQVMAPPQKDWGIPKEKMEATIRGWAPPVAEHKFLRRFEMLYV